MTDKDKNASAGPERRREDIMVPYSMLGMILAVILQTMSAVWWSSGVNVKLDYLQKTQTELSAAITATAVNRYTSIDAARDSAAIDKRFDYNETQLKIFLEKTSINERKIAVIESRLLGATKNNPDPGH